MARIAGVNIPKDKRIIIALTYVYGIGKSRAQDILKEAGVDKNLRTHELTDKQLDAIRDEIKKYSVEGDARREKMLNIRRLKEIDAYRGERHKKNLPVRGQRTKTNSRTVRGNVRRTMGSGKVKIEKT